MVTPRQPQSYFKPFFILVSIVPRRGRLPAVVTMMGGFLLCQVHQVDAKTGKLVSSATLDTYYPRGTNVNAGAVACL